MNHQLNDGEKFFRANTKSNYRICGYVTMY